jgi:hypothetical protein
MLLEAMDKPIKYRLRDGRELLLEPGVPVDVPDAAASYLLRKVSGRVRIAPGVLINDSFSDFSPVFWRCAAGTILGPGFMRHHTKVHTNRGDYLWLLVEYQGSWRWISETLLRKRKAFEKQQCKGNL